MVLELKVQKNVKEKGNAGLSYAFTLLNGVVATSGSHSL